MNEPNSPRRRICLCVASEVKARQPFSGCVADNCAARARRDRA